MELCCPRVECDPDLGPDNEQFVDGTLFGRAHIRRRDDANAAAARNDTRKRFAEMSHAGPDHERADQINRVRARQLGTQL